MSVGCNEVEIVPQIHVLLEAHHLALFGKRVFADVKGHPGLRVGLKSDNWCLSQRVEGGLILRHAGRGHGAMEAHPGGGAPGAPRSWRRQEGPSKGNFQSSEHESIHFCSKPPSLGHLLQLP